MALFDKSGDAGFEGLVARPPKVPLTPTVPESAHFVVTEVHELDWLNYAIVRSALDWWGAEKVNIWVPVGEELPGPMWERVLKLQNMTARDMHVPNGVWDKTLNFAQHMAIVARMKMLYEEGGYVDHNLMALKSSDDVIHNVQARSAILPRMNKGSAGRRVNPMIMAKA